jgi:hypothetical protein
MEHSDSHLNQNNEFIQYMENHNHCSPTHSINIHSFNIIRVYSFSSLKLRILWDNTALTSHPCRYGSTVAFINDL